MGDTKMKEDKTKYDKFKVKPVICSVCKMEVEEGWTMDYKDNLIAAKKCGCNVDWMGT